MSITDAGRDTPAGPAGPGPSIEPDRLAVWRRFLEAHAYVVERLERDLLEREDLPLGWYDVLIHLSEAPDGRLRMQDLADAVLLSKSGLSRLVKRMEADGLVSREACPTDRRGTFACLTDAGRERLRATAPTHVAGVARHFTDLLDDAEVATLGAALDRIATAARQD